MKRLEGYNFLKKVPKTRDFKCSGSDEIKCGLICGKKKCPISSLSFGNTLPRKLADFSVKKFKIDKLRKIKKKHDFYCNILIFYCILTGLKDFPLKVYNFKVNKDV